MVDLPVQYRALLCVKCTCKQTKQRENERQRKRERKEFKKPQEAPVFLPLQKFPIIKIIQSSMHCITSLKSECPLRSTTKLRPHVSVRCGSRLLCGVLEANVWALSSVPEQTQAECISLLNVITCCYNVHL